MPEASSKPKLEEGNISPHISAVYASGADGSISRAHFRQPAVPSVPSTVEPSLFGSPITPLYAAAGVLTLLCTKPLLTFSQSTVDRLHMVLS
jgi:hypothetical protein